MWNFEDKVKTNDIEEICNLLKTYKGQWVAMVDRSSGATEYDGSTCEDYSWCLKVENAEPISDRQFNFYGKFLKMVWRTSLVWNKLVLVIDLFHFV